MTSKTMLAMVLHVASATAPASQTLRLETRPIPTPQNDQVLIRVKAFGLNHSELADRLAEPNPLGPLALPRILGIECVGIVEENPCTTSSLPKGTVVMAALGGMGRMFDGSYAEFCVASTDNVIPVAESEAELRIPWALLGALPEMLQTAHGALFRSLQLKDSDTLLIRGATSSVGLTAIALAKRTGAKVIASTRNAANEELLMEAGADSVVLSPNNASLIPSLQSHDINKILDLVGAKTVLDSLRCLAPGGVCCNAGTLGGEWSLTFFPIFQIPTGRFLTGYAETGFRGEITPWGDLLAWVQEGGLKANVGKVWEGLESVVQAHDAMAENRVGGKGVVVV